MADERVALVLGGGGARGAYEVGALSVLLPTLERRGQRPNLFTGTSVGAINAAYLAATADLPAEASAQGLLRHWRDVELGRVIRPLISYRTAVAALRSVAGAAYPAEQQPSSLLDPEPLIENLRHWVDWAALGRNVDDGTVDMLSVVGTAVWTGHTVVFCDSRRSDTHRRRAHRLDYVPTRIGLEHIRASAAIPILFPPVRVDHPDEARGWYVDGGTRLNTPIKPALDNGADRVVVIGTSSVVEPAHEPGRHDSGPPSMSDGAINILQGALVDRLIEDLWTLGSVNAFFADGAPRAQAYRESRGKPPYRQVPYMFVGPARNAIGQRAVEVFRSRYEGFKGLRSPDFALLNMLLGPGRAGRGELLSYVLFDGEFVEALVEMGARDARNWLARPRPWQLEPLRDLVARGA